MFLTKGGITIQVGSPADIKRYKGLGFVEVKVGYPDPATVVDGVKGESGKPAGKATGKKAVKDGA